MKIEGRGAVRVLIDRGIVVGKGQGSEESMCDIYISVHDLETAGLAPHAPPPTLFFAEGCWRQNNDYDAHVDVRPAMTYPE